MNFRSFNFYAGIAFLLAFLLASFQANSYPLDGEPESGIRRVLADRVAAQPAGARLASDAVRLHMLDQPMVEFDAHKQDPTLAGGLEKLLKSRDPSYAMVIVDFSEPNNLRWAGLRPDTRRNAGSVGKLLSMLGLFHALAEAFPDPDDRQRVLRETLVEAGDWVLGDSHVVPHFNTLTGKNTGAVLVPSDSFRLSEWIDHAISASANGAGSVIWREAMLLMHLKDQYPGSAEQRRSFFANTSKTQLSALAKSIIQTPLLNAQLDIEAMTQGSFWTPTSKRHVPGGQSFATPRELARFMLRMEQGRLVDLWSSLTMKKYMYISKRRYRYVYAPELAPFAAYFKSGSLYQCQPEENFRCGKYLGNVRNLMNSVATIESMPQHTSDTRYTSALTSNVLKINSAWDHSRIAAAIHQLITTRQAVELRETASDAELRDAGRSE